MWKTRLTGINVSLPPTKNKPRALLSVVISIVTSLLGSIGQVAGSAGGSEKETNVITLYSNIWLGYIEKKLHSVSKNYVFGTLPK